MKHYLRNYKQDWNKFRLYIEEKAKDRCVVTSKNWLKLKDIHLNRFLRDSVEDPFHFLFNVRFFHPIEYSKNKYMPKYYGQYKQFREDKFNEIYLKINPERVKMEIDKTIKL